MLAESVRSVADSANQALLLLGRRRAAQAQTEEHPFGFGRERYFYAFVVAVVLFTGGAIFSFYEGIHKITHPEPIQSPVVAFVVLAIAIVLESLSLRTAVRESNRVRGSGGWLAFIRRAKAPELPAVLLEDMAALTGLFFAAVGVGAAGDPRQRGVGRGRFTGDRHLAGRRRDDPGGGDEEPAHRRVRQRRGGACDRRRARGG